MKKFFSILIILFSLLVADLAKADDSSFDVAASHAIAIEMSTGKILYEKDAYTPTGIASITKILTVYLVYKEIDEGNLTWDTQVAISDYAYDLTTNSQVSNVPMEARNYTVKQLVNAAMIASANSAAIALAEKIGGSETQFVDMMRKQLEDWGITDATIVNASGLNNSMLGDNIYPGSSSTDENMLSAADVAIVAQHLITDYPQILQITSQTSADFDGTTMTTSNEMLEGQTYYRQGVDGLKTGTTELAGACFVATTNENGMRVITVVLHADNADTDDGARFEATNDLLNYIYNNYELKTILKKGSSYKNSAASVIGGKSDSVSAVAKADLTVVQKINSKSNKNIKISINELTAPVSKGDTVGTATYNDTDLVGKGYLGDLPSVKLVAENDIKRAFFLKFYWQNLVHSLS